jgi:hypothetical protein
MMRKLAISGLVAALLCVGAAVTVRAADKDDEPSGLGSWWDGLFGGKDKPAPKKSEPLVEEEKPAAPSPAERADVVRQRELKAYFRRIAVCDRLMDIAYEKNDTDMIRRVEELMEQVGEVYVKRTAGLAADGPDDEAPRPRDKAKQAAPRGGERNRGTGEDER